MSNSKYKISNRGFTLVELLLIMGIMAVLLGIVTINLAKAQRNTNLSTAIETFEADMKSQQLKAMSGASANGTTGDQYGVYIIPSAKNTYMPFHGTSYSSDCVANFCVALDSSITLTPSVNPIIFSQQTGEIGTPVTVVVSNSMGEQKTITINKNGVVTQVR